MLTHCNIQSGDNYSTVVRQDASSYAVQCCMNTGGFLCTPSSVVWTMKLSCVHHPVFYEWWSFYVYTTQCCGKNEAFQSTWEQQALCSHQMFSPIRPMVVWLLLLLPQVAFSHTFSDQYLTNKQRKPSQNSRTLCAVFSSPWLCP